MHQPLGFLLVLLCFNFLLDWRRLWIAFVCTAPWAVLLAVTSEQTGGGDLASRLDELFGVRPPHQGESSGDVIQPDVPKNQTPLTEGGSLLPATPAVPKIGSSELIGSRPSRQDDSKPESVEAPRNSNTRPEVAPNLGEDETTQKALLSQWIRSISNGITSTRRYPRLAAQRGWQGEVRLTLTVGEVGDLRSVVVHQSSGYESLDLEAVSMAERAAPFPPPRGLLRQTVTTQVPVIFRLQTNGDGGSTERAPSSTEGGAENLKKPMGPLPPENSVGNKPPDTAAVLAARWYYRGSVAYEKGDYDEAIKAFEESLKLQPGDPDALRGLQLVKKAQEKAVMDMQIR